MRAWRGEDLQVMRDVSENFLKVVVAFVGVLFVWAVLYAAVILGYTRFQTHRYYSGTKSHNRIVAHVRWLKPAVVTPKRQKALT